MAHQSHRSRGRQEDSQWAVSRVWWNAILCGSARILHLFSMFRFDFISARFAAGPRSVDKRRVAIGTCFLLPRASRWRSLIGRGWFSSRHHCGRSRPRRPTAWNAGTNGGGRDTRSRSGNARKSSGQGLAVDDWRGAKPRRLGGPLLNSETRALGNVNVKVPSDWRAAARKPGAGRQGCQPRVCF